MSVANALRDLTAEDVPALQQIERQVQSFPWSGAMFSECFGGRYSSTGLELDGQLVGFCICDYVLDEGTIHNIAVLPGFQRRGLGQRLLDAAVQHARQLQLSKLFLEVRISNGSAIELYLKNRFTRVGLRKDYYPARAGREDGIVMCLELQQS